MKYRIIARKRGKGDFYYYIERKKFLTWREVYKGELGNSFLHFDSYEECEEYMMENWFEFKEVIIINDIYHVI